LQRTLLRCKCTELASEAKMPPPSSVAELLCSRQSTRVTRARPAAASAPPRLPWLLASSTASNSTWQMACGPQEAGDQQEAAITQGGKGLELGWCCPGHAEKAFGMSSTTAKMLCLHLAQQHPRQPSIRAHTQVGKSGLMHRLAHWLGNGPGRVGYQELGRSLPGNGWWPQRPRPALL
jgi:hypothetical protein